MKKVMRPLLAIAIFVFTFGFFVYLATRILKAQTEIEILAERTVQLADRKVDTSGLLGQLNGLSAIPRDELGFLAAETNEAAIERIRDTVVRLAAEQNIQVNSSASQPTRSDGLISTATLRVTLAGPADRVFGLITSIENSHPALFFESLDIASNVGIADSINRSISINAAINGYWIALPRSEAKK